MSIVNVSFPGNLAQVSTASDLRALPSALISSDEIVLVTALGHVYSYSPGSLAVDDGALVLKPIDRSTLQAGRWLQSVQGLAPGAPGTPGAANSTYTSLTALKAAPIDNGSYILADGVNAPVLYGYVAGNFTGKADNRSVVKLDAVPLTVGALVRQSNTENNVKDFGAKGDGVTNDTMSIQAAIDYTYQSGGGTVLLPPGTFMLDYINNGGFGLICLGLNSNVNIKGSGKGITTLKLQDNASLFGVGSQAGLMRPLNVPLVNVVMSDFTIDGNWTNQPNAHDPYWDTVPKGNGGNIYIDVPVVDITVRNIESINAFGQGIQIAANHDNPGTRVVVQGCKVLNPTFIGIQCSQLDTWRIEDNFIQGSGDNAIDIYGAGSSSDASIKCVRGLVTRNICRDAGGAAIFLETIAETTVIGNIGENCINGIHANVIYGLPSALLIEGNQMNSIIDNAYVVSGALEATFRGNYGEFWGASFFCAGTPGGESSFWKYEGNIARPTNSSKPIMILNPGVLAHNFVDPGVANYLVEVPGDPTPASKFRFNPGGAGTTLSPYPVWSSALNLATPSARIRSPQIEDTPRYAQALAVYADNASALSALGVGVDYLRDADGAIYRTHS